MTYTESHQASKQEALVKWSTYSRALSKGLPARGQFRGKKLSKGEEKLTRDLVGLAVGSRRHDCETSSCRIIVDVG